MPLAQSQRSTLWGLAALLIVVVLGFALWTMDDDDGSFLDAIPFAPHHATSAAAPEGGATPLAEDALPLDSFVPSAVLPLSPQDALARNLALPLSHASNPLAPSFVAAWLGADLDRQTDCLAKAVYYEANGEPLAGQRAVAQVVLNRLRHPRYPKTICAVVNQGAERPTGCQFSFTCDGSLARAPNPARFKLALAVAAAALNGAISAEAGQATHYHTLYVFPKWAPELLKLGVLGHHVFYRLPGQPYDYSGFRAAAGVPSDAALAALPDVPPADADAAAGATPVTTTATSGATVGVGIVPPTYPGPTVTPGDAATAAATTATPPSTSPSPRATATEAPRTYFPERRSQRPHLALPQ